MADIKTRDTVKGTIRTLDKAKIASSRMKSAYIQITAIGSLLVLLANTHTTTAGLLLWRRRCK